MNVYYFVIFFYDLREYVTSGRFVSPLTNTIGYMQMQLL